MRGLLLVGAILCFVTCAVLVVVALAPKETERS